MSKFILVAVILAVAYGQTIDPNINCALFPGTALFQVLCNDVTLGMGNVLAYAQEGICSQHCQCVHGNAWGQCATRSPSQPQGIPALGLQYCQCFNTPPPPGKFIFNCSEATNKASAVPFVTALCAIQTGPHTGGCNDDCYCTHGVQYGWCDGSFPLQAPTKCTCTNETASIPSNTYYVPVVG